MDKKEIEEDKAFWKHDREFRETIEKMFDDTTSATIQTIDDTTLATIQTINKLTEDLQNTLDEMD